LFAEVDERQVGAFRLLVPDLSTVDLLALVLSAGAFLALFRFKTGMLATLFVSALVGAIARLVSS
jgi:chromate transporter